MRRNQWLILTAACGLIVTAPAVDAIVCKRSREYKDYREPVAVVSDDQPTKGKSDSASTEDELVSTLQAGMAEEAVRRTMKKVAQDSGTVYWGGSGARRVYFALSGRRQIWVECAGASGGFKVVKVGRIEPKQRWIRHSGDSITVE